MVDIAYIKELILCPEKLGNDTLETLRQLCEEFPAFPAVRLLYLENLRIAESPYFNAELKKSELYMPHTIPVPELLDRLSAVRRSRLLAADQTMNLLDSFLGPASADEQLSLETPAATDYLSLSGVGETISADTDSAAEGSGKRLSATDELLASLAAGADIHIGLADAGHPSLSDLSDVDADSVPDLNPQDNCGQPDYSENGIPLNESLFTETLAQIYIRQRRYKEAREIIQSLYLNFPNKSSYFADQIRYLDKLIEINKQKEK